MLLVWHIVHKQQENMAGPHRQNGCICRLVVVLTEHNLHNPSNLVIRALRSCSSSFSDCQILSCCFKVKERSISIFDIGHGGVISVYKTSLI